MVKSDKELIIWILFVFLIVLLFAIVMVYLTLAKAAMFLSNKISNAQDNACQNINYSSYEYFNKGNYCMDKEGALHPIILKDNTIGFGNLNFTAKKIKVVN